MAKKLSETSAQIKAIEDDYGQLLFSMGFSQLMDMGRNELLDVAAVDEILQEIRQSTPANAIMTADFQCEIIKCAADLAKFSPVQLMLYVKSHMTINE